MATKIRVTAGEVEVRGTLTDTPTAQAIAAALPITALAQHWGEEIYFNVPVEMNAEPNARETVVAGEIGYWPDGPAFCIFYGPTPASRGEEIRAATPVNIIGIIDGDITELRKIKRGAVIEVKRG